MIRASTGVRNKSNDRSLFSVLVADVSITSCMGRTGGISLCTLELEYTALSLLTGGPRPFFIFALFLLPFFNNCCCLKVWVETKNVVSEQGERKDWRRYTKWGSPRGLGRRQTDSRMPTDRD